MLNYGWVCPKCGRVYAPNQEMCLYCGQKEQAPTINNLGDWISTNPCIIDTQKGPTNIREANGTSGSPFYTTTTGSISYEGSVPKVVLDAQKTEAPCSAYVDEMCLGVKEPFKSDCNGLPSKCTEYKEKKYEANK